MENSSPLALGKLYQRPYTISGCYICIYVSLIYLIFCIYLIYFIWCLYFMCRVYKTVLIKQWPTWRSVYPASLTLILLQWHHMPWLMKTNWTRRSSSSSSVQVVSHSCPKHKIKLVYLCFSDSDMFEDDFHPKQGIPLWSKSSKFRR